MGSYSAPVRDLFDALYHGAGLDRLEPLFPDLDPDTVLAVLEAGGALAGDTLAPLNAAGDRDGARLTADGVVTTPGFAQAYRAFAEGGWNGLAADGAHGGQGLPKALALAVFEMAHGANMALALCPMLTQGAIEAITAHGSPTQKALYLPRLISGEWTGAMDLTEPQAGSDLAGLTTRAEPDGQGGYRLFGQKIYITWGDHDCAENIVHMVLARLPDAPAGVKGISLFIAPKRRVDATGGLGEANSLRCVGLEHKLGIHGSPTCTMLYDGAWAEMIGGPGTGLAQMFTMMNAARLQVGAQGVGIAERAFQQALAFAQDRRQGRSVLTGQANAPIFDHPDIRRLLLSIKARIQGGRLICLQAAVAADLAQVSPNEPERLAAAQREALLTPIAKAWCTDMGVQVASDALQIHGGMGFIEDTGAAQPYRDARIAPIYEGTNGIQAIDLVFRKLRLGDGAAIVALFEEFDQVIERLAVSEDSRLVRLCGRLEASLAQARISSAWLMERGQDADAYAGAYPFLTLMGDLAAGAGLARQALAPARPGRDPAALAAAFGETALSMAPGLAAAVLGGAAHLRGLTTDQLAP